MYEAKSIVGCNFHLFFPFLSHGSGGVYQTLHVADAEVSQGSVLKKCDKPAHSCLQWPWGNWEMWRTESDNVIFFTLVWGFCNALGLFQNPTCYVKIQPARWSHDLSFDCCFAGGQPLWIVSIISSFSGWNCLKIQLRFAMWLFGSWEDGSCWQAQHFLSSNPAAVRFWCAMAPPFPLDSLSQDVASQQLQCFQDSLNYSYSQDGGRDSYPADHSQPLCTGSWHPVFPDVGMLVLGWSGWACDDGGLVTTWINLTGPPPPVLKRCCRSPGLELCCTRIQLRPPSYRLLKVLVEISLLLKTLEWTKKLWLKKFWKICINVLIPNLGIEEGFLWLKTWNFKVREQNFWRNPSHRLGVDFKTFSVGILFLNHMLV